MDFINVEKKYFPVSMWVFNDKLNIEETHKQLLSMKESKIGGFIINSDAGLSSRYLGDEWFRNETKSLNFATENDMFALIADDIGVLSGTSDGTINSEGIDYQQKTLKFESGDKTNDRTIIYKDGLHFYYDVNPYYIDVLNPAVSEIFIEKNYNLISSRTTESFNGFYSSEVHISSNSIPWSFVIPEKYKEEYGEEILEHLIELFREVGNYQDTRIKFWKLVSKLFSKNFMLPLYKWCSSKKYNFSAKLCNANSLYSQMLSCGDAIMQYKNMDIPVVSFNSDEKLSILQASSVAAQFNKKMVVAQMENCNYNLTFDNVRKLYLKQLMRGAINLSVGYDGYSAKGYRKHTAIPSLHTQQTISTQFASGYTELARLGKILSEGTFECKVLLIDNLTSVWKAFNSNLNDSVVLYDNYLKEAIDHLEKKHIPFHITSELLLEKYASVKNGELLIGQQSYNTIVVTPSSGFLPETEKLLYEFSSQGGNVCYCDDLKENNICNSENLLYTSRKYDGFNVHIFYNDAEEYTSASIEKSNKKINLSNGETEPFYGIYEFAPYEIIALIEDGSAPLSRPFKKPLKEFKPSENWEYQVNDYNALLIDICDVYFDNELIKADFNAADVVHLANEKSDKISIRCDYKFYLKNIPSEIFLACEYFDLFKIAINDEEVLINKNGYFLNSSIDKANITPYLKDGENIISLSMDYSPNLKIKEISKKSIQMENELRRISYSGEFSSIYLVGYFGVYARENFIQLDKNAVRYPCGFIIDCLPDKVNISNIERNGFPFFSGSITFKNSFNISDIGYFINPAFKNLKDAVIKINDKIAELPCYSPHKCDISSLLTKGNNTIEITIFNTQRNVFGPHHIPVGEIENVKSKHFYSIPCAWNQFSEVPWNDDYCIAEFGVEF